MTTLEICAIVAVGIFAALAYFLIQTLLSVQRSLKRSDQLIDDVKIKMGNLNPFFHSLSNVGEVTERQSERFKQSALSSNPTSNHSYDLLEWLILSIKLGEKFINRR